MFGFNGRHIGWFHQGMFFDQAGWLVAAPARAFVLPVRAAPVRGLKQLKPLKGLKELVPLQPLFRNAWSDLPAYVWLTFGRK